MSASAPTPPRCLTTQFGISPWLTLPASLVVTMAVAGLIGAITVRLSGHYLPLGTIAWGIAFFYLFGNIDWLGAHDGLAGIPPLRVGTHPLIDPRDYFVVVWIAVVLAVIATQNLLGGRIGRAIRALRRSTRAAEAFGVNTAAAKLLVFVYAAMLAGLAGWLYAHFQRSVSPGPFGITAGTEYLLMAVLGGAGRVYGAILGAAGITFLRDQLQNFLPWLIGNTGNYETIAFGAVLVLILQTASSGVWPILFGPPPPPTPPEPRDDKTTPERTLPAPGTALLQVQDARKVFGGLVAVNDVNFEVQSGRIIGLIGPNGAGKSTTFNLITGVLPLSSGQIQFEGHALRTQTPQRAAALGLGRTFQHVEIVADMSVIENVALGAHLLGRAGPLRAMLRLDRAEEALLFANAKRQLDRVGLADVAFRPAGTLALGQLRLVEVARALCLNPVLLLLDEPAAGLRVGEKKALARLLREVRSEGLSVLLVEHDMDFVMSSRRPAGGARFRHQDRRRYPRRHQAAPRRARGLSRRRIVTAPLLDVRNLCVSYGRAQVVHDVSIAVTPGALVTVIGSNGAGKTTLLNAIMGLLKAKGGIGFRGTEVSAVALESRVQSGLCLVPERRELFADMPVEDNLLLGGFRRSRAERKQTLEEIFARLPRLKERRQQLAGTLSGGERQMLAMGRALMARPVLLMLDEPSLGLAPRIVRDVFHILTDLRQTGVSILLVEQNARAALEVADYAYVMELGAITTQGSPQQIAADPRLVESYLGLGGNEY